MDDGSTKGRGRGEAEVVPPLYQGPQTSSGKTVLGPYIAEQAPPRESFVGKCNRMRKMEHPEVAGLLPRPGRKAKGRRELQYSSQHNMEEEVANAKMEGACRCRSVVACAWCSCGQVT